MGASDAWLITLLVVAAILVAIILSLVFRFNIFMFIVRKFRELKERGRKQYDTRRKHIMGL